MEVQREVVSGITEELPLVWGYYGTRIYNFRRNKNPYFPSGTRIRYLRYGSKSAVSGMGPESATNICNFRLGSFCNSLVEKNRHCMPMWILQTSNEYYGYRFRLSSYCGAQKWLRIRFYYLRNIDVITLQDWVGWGIFTVIPGYPRRASGDSQHSEARSELQDWLRFEFFTVKNYRTGPFSK